MQLQFDAQQPHQLLAVEAVADLFLGQRRVSPHFADRDPDELFGPIPNRLDLFPDQILANLKTVQRRNRIPESEKLEHIEEEISFRGGGSSVRFPNFSVEMETGTGKTYAYIRTALELHRRYGLRKYIIVVHSVAVREGVMKTLRITRDHFRAVYENVPYSFNAYEGKSVAKVRSFALGDSVEFLVMTIDSFNKDDAVIRRGTDGFPNPLEHLQTVRPVLILDEPQNLESELRVKALASLRPLMALRYSATHRNPYNVCYRVTPFDAYRLGLVKRVEVDSVRKHGDHNAAFLRLDEVRSSGRKLQAKIAMHQRMKTGQIAEKAYLFGPDARLIDKAERSEYQSFVIDEIHAGEGWVRFGNGIVLRLHQSHGADQSHLFAAQIKRAVEAHLRKQHQLRPRGVKVISLFFIDRVENYAGTAPPEKGAGRVDGLYPGIIRELFDQAFDDLKGNYPEFASLEAGQVRRAYFAQKGRRGASESVDSSGQSKEDRDAYDLILRDKERLLSFAEPAAFIFSHSALREGWDNPNVCQICTLNQTVSELKKRQEIGRGMRLLVDQDGRRVTEEALNVLTVIANESYEQFVETLQTEMEDAFGKDGAAPKPRNKNDRYVAARPADADLPPEFAELWERIRRKTRYQVTIDSDQLVRDAVADLDARPVQPPQIVAETARVVLKGAEDELDWRVTNKRVLARLPETGPTPNLVAMIEEILAHVTPPVRLTRRTLARVVTGVRDRAAASANPQEFAQRAAEALREKALRQLVQGIRYEPDGTVFEMSQWAAREETTSDRIVSASNALYDKVVVQSETEKKFAEALARLDYVKLFVKLPAWFKVPTPVGNYNPDWALVMEDNDGGPLLYLVRETKGTTAADALRGAENQKILCGERHFTGALGVDFKVVTSADQLP